MYEVVEGTHDLLDSAGVVPGMHPQDVEVVGAQPAKAGLDRLAQVLARIAGRVGVTRPHGERVLRSDDPLIAVRGEIAPEDLLGLALVVFVRGVDEVAALLREGVENPVALLLVGPEAPDVAEAHRAEADLGDPDAAGSEESISHLAHLL